MYPSSNHITLLVTVWELLVDLVEFFERHGWKPAGPYQAEEVVISNDSAANFLASLRIVETPFSPVSALCGSSCIWNAMSQIRRHLNTFTESV
jgi:hypothetical protein